MGDRKVVNLRLVRKFDGNKKVSFLSCFDGHLERISDKNQYDDSFSEKELYLTALNSVLLSKLGILIMCDADTIHLLPSSRANRFCYVTVDNHRPMRLKNSGQLIFRYEPKSIIEPFQRASSSFDQDDNSDSDYEALTRDEVDSIFSIFSERDATRTRGRGVRRGTPSTRAKPQPRVSSCSMNASIDSDISKALETNSYYSSNDSSDEAHSLKPQHATSAVGIVRSLSISEPKIDTLDIAGASRSKEDEERDRKYKTTIHYPAGNDKGFTDDVQKTLRSVEEVDRFLKTLGGKKAKKPLSFNNWTGPFDLYECEFTDYTVPVFDVSAEHTRGAHIVSVKDAPPGSARNLVVFDTTSGLGGC